MVLRVHTGFVTHCPRALPGQPVARLPPQERYRAVPCGVTITYRVRHALPPGAARSASRQIATAGTIPSGTLWRYDHIQGSSRIAPGRCPVSQSPDCHRRNDTERYPVALRSHTGFVTHCPRALPGYISKGSMLSTGWPTLLRYSRSCSGSSVQIVSSAIMSVKFSTPYSSSAEASSRSRT